MGRQFSAAGWTAQVNTPAYPAIGVCLGSAYQAYFNALSTSARAAEVSAMRAAGIAWVRMDVNWKLAQPSSTSAPSFSFAATTAQSLVAGGMHVVAIMLSDASFWPLAVGNNPDLTTTAYPSVAPVDSAGGICPFPTVAPSVFATFCAAAVSALSPLGVEAFEICNEPNLDFPNVSSSFPGLGFLEPVGYASLATAAYAAMTASGVYQPGVAGQRPTPIVLGGALAGSARLDYVPKARAGASWGAVNAGDKTAVITCASALTSDRYALIAGAQVSVLASNDPSAFGGQWPPGTYVSSVTTDSSGNPTGYVVSPPPTLGAFPAIPAAAATSFGIADGFPPDVYMVQAYQAAGGAPMFDALSLHPYTWPGQPADAWLDSGSWGIVPGVRQIMTDNGDGGKQIWFTEIGAPTGQFVATWPAAAATDTQLVVSCTTAATEHLGWLVDAAGVPANSYVATVQPGVSWTVVPPTGLILTGLDATTKVSSGATTSTLGVASTRTSSTVSIAAGTAVTAWFGGYGTTGAMNGWALPPVSTTLTAAASVPPAAASGTPGTSVTIDVDSVTLPAGLNSYPAAGGGVVQGSVTPAPQWGAAIAAGSGVTINLVAPGCVPQWGETGSAVSYSSESQQAAIIGESFALSVVTPQYIGPVFVYCWSDIGDGWNAGPFGLKRVDGTAKPALGTLTALARAAGRVP